MTMTAPGRRRVAQAELPDVLVAHRRWLEGEPHGMRANLQGCDLEGIAFPFGVDLRRALMSGASLVGCRLEDADLRECDLQYADLRDAILARTNLADADLRFSRHLLPDQLNGPNLLRTQLPDGTVAEVARPLEGLTESTGKLVLSLIISGMAVLLYAAAAPDAALINNVPARNNPISAVAISFLAFSIVVPAGMFGVYLYLQIQLQRLWNYVARLPRVFPDGRTVLDQGRSWIGAGFVAAGARWPPAPHTPLAGLQYLLEVFVLWCFVPLIMGAIWLRYLVCHEWTLSLAHAALAALSAVAA